MALRLVTAPTGSLVPVGLVKSHLNIDCDDFDPLIEGYLAAVNIRIEAETQRRYLAQTLDWILDCWPAQLRLPIAPSWGASGMAVASVIYADASGAAQTLAVDQYWAKPDGQTLTLVPRRGVIWPLLGDAAERLKVRIVVTGTGEDAPANVRHAALLMVGDYFANREAQQIASGALTQVMNPETEALLALERWS